MLKEYEENEERVEEYLVEMKEELDRAKMSMMQGMEYNHLKEKEMVYRFLRARNMIKLI